MFFRLCILAVFILLNFAIHIGTISFGRVVHFCIIRGCRSKSLQNDVFLPLKIVRS